MSVDPHFAVAVHAIELDEHQPARVPRGQGEGLTVPAHAAGERSAARAGGIGIAELSLDAPVVRHIEVAPGGIVERRILSVRDVAQVESPGAVEGENPALPRRHRRCVRRGEQGEEADDGSANLHGRAATLIVRLSRMSADDAPTAISTGSVSTTPRGASGLQLARGDTASGNAT